MIGLGLAILLTLAPPPRAVSQHLPLVVVSPTLPPNGMLALLITGDGGWANLDRTVAAKLAGDGTVVVGLNSLHYFAKAKTSAALAADLTSTARSECEQWSCRRIALIGYSMGADVLPFVVNQLAPDVRSRLQHLVFISLGHQAIFKFFPTQWIGLTVGHRFATLPELRQIQSVHMVCVYGRDDKDSVCNELPDPNATVIGFAGGHTLHNVAADVAVAVAREIDGATVSNNRQ